MEELWWCHHLAIVVFSCWYPKDVVALWMVLRLLVVAIIVFTRVVRHEMCYNRLLLLLLISAIKCKWSLLNTRYKIILFISIMRDFCSLLRMLFQSCKKETFKLPPDNRDYSSNPNCLFLHVSFIKASKDVYLQKKSQKCLVFFEIIYPLFKSVIIIKSSNDYWIFDWWWPCVQTSTLFWRIFIWRLFWRNLNIWYTDVEKDVILPWKKKLKNKRYYVCSRSKKKLFLSEKNCSIFLYILYIFFYFFQSFFINFFL